MSREGNGEQGAATSVRPHRCPLWLQSVLASPLRRLAESPESLLGPYVAPGMTVVEPGCGFGFFSLPLARMVGPSGKVLCVDVEPAAVARLERRAAGAGLGGRIEARACSVTDLGLGDRAGHADLVTVLHMLHEVEDLAGFMRQAMAALHPGGRMLVLEPGGHVRPEQFAAECAACRDAGFRELPLERAPRGRLVALFERPPA
jgi:2-polyprenyl-3-methyl-5-hydroxy-6-metoxy-1,4-benzoquinol methylase